MEIVKLEKETCRTLREGWRAESDQSVCTLRSEGESVARQATEGEDGGREDGSEC